MNQKSNDAGVVIVSPDEMESQYVSRPVAPRWPLALAGLLLVGLGITGFLAWQQGQARARLQSEVTKLKQSNQTLNEENSKVKEMLDQQMQNEQTKTTELETRLKTLETANNEWTTVQANIGGTGYRPGATTVPAAAGATPAEEPAIAVASSVKVFRLDMNLAKLADYPEYTADITGPAGQKPSLIKVTKATNGVAILIASSNLTDGKYVVKLSGKKDGISKELGKGYSVNLAFPK
jgi:flagellar motor protein MotB